MKTTRFEPKGKLEIFVMGLRQEILKAKMTADVDIISTGNVNITNARLNKPVYHTAPYDPRYVGENWYFDEEQVPGKSKGKVQIVPVARSVFDPTLKIRLKKSTRLNYEDWCVINALVNEVADQYVITFNLKSTTHTVRQGAEWGSW